MLITDDLNTWAGAWHAPSRGLTPELNALAKRSVVFANAFCASPLCNPSRTAVLSGMAPWNTGVYNNGHWWRPAMPELKTMPVLFREAGYTVAGAGKLFHHTAGFNPPDQWDEFVPFRWDDPWDRPAVNYPEIPETKAPDYVPLNGIEPLRHEFDWGVLPKPESEYGDSRSVAWTEAFLARKQEKPFFLALGLFRPHIPWFSPEQDFAVSRENRFLPQRLDSDLEDVPAIGHQFASAGRPDLQRVEKLRKWEEAVTAYRASIHFADRLFGRVLRALEKCGEAENTIIVFWSDNGYHLGEKERFHKSTLWERACRVPMMVALPGGKSGVCTAPVSLLDILPTLAELCDVHVPQATDGQSLLTLLDDPARDSERVVVTNFQPGNYAVSNGQFRYIRYRDGGEELYDLNADPNEWRNLAGNSGMRPMVRKLAAAIPPNEAQPVPGKDSYRFDPNAYTWKRKAE